MKYSIIIALLLIVQPAVGQETIDNENKQAVINSIENQSANLTELSDEIWQHAEIAFKEDI